MIHAKHVVSGHGWVGGQKRFWFEPSPVPVERYESFGHMCKALKRDPQRWMASCLDRDRDGRDLCHALGFDPAKSGVLTVAKDYTRGQEITYANFLCQFDGDDAWIADHLRFVLSPQGSLDLMRQPFDRDGKALVVPPGPAHIADVLSGRF